MNTGPVFVDVAVKDLSGAALDWAVAKALGYVDYPDDSVEQGAWWYTDPVKAPFSARIRKVDWEPSTDWRQGSPVIASGLISLVYEPVDAPGAAGEWCAWFRHDSPQFRHQSQLVAGCRALVAATLGDIVKVPAGLVLP